jgi:hypothetical protein
MAERLTKHGRAETRGEKPVTGACGKKWTKRLEKNGSSEPPNLFFGLSELTKRLMLGKIP